MRICVIGTGYVGLVAGAGFAEFGNEVVAVDVDAARIARLQRGEVPIHEPGLAPMLQRALARGLLRFTTGVEEGVRGARAVFLAVGTPSRPDGACDTSQVEATAEAVGRALDGFTVVAIKSTVPVGTHDRVHEIVARACGGRDFAIASNPEFLTEGNAVSDFCKPARVLLGVRDARAERLLRALYGPFVRATDRIMVTDPRSAEICKYACNAFLAARISFMNELARLCERVGADVEHVRHGMAWDDRIGPRYLYAGAGFGGSCLPKDVRALAAVARSHGLTLRIAEAVRDVNEEQRRLLGERVLAHLGGTAGRVVAVWGLSFKPETDDVRESPSQPLVEALLARGVRVRAHDPVANEAFARQVPGPVEYLDDPYAAVEGADALVLVTEWRAFRRPDFERVRAGMRTPAIFDGRNIWSPAELRALGFTYHGIGRAAS